jgi:cell division protein ZapA
MPELTLEIGGRLYEVACEPGEEKALERAAELLDVEAMRMGDAGRATEKRMLLLSGLMLADSMRTLENQLAETEERLRMAEERIRIAEAKAAMLAANALKHETELGHRARDTGLAALREEHANAIDLLNRVLAEVNAMADAAEASGR